MQEALTFLNKTCLRGGGGGLADMANTKKRLSRRTKSGAGLPVDSKLCFVEACCRAVDGQESVAGARRSSSLSLFLCRRDSAAHIQACQWALCPLALPDEGLGWGGGGEGGSIRSVSGGIRWGKAATGFAVG